MFLGRCSSVISVLSNRGLYRRNPKPFKGNSTPINNVKDIIEESNIASPTDWHSVREKILGLSHSRNQINAHTVDSMTIGVCTSIKKYDLAFSYLAYLEDKQITPNLAAIGKLFKMLYLKNCNDVCNEDESRILALYEKMRISYPVLDALTLDSVIQAISLTTKWKLCCDLLEETKISTTPTALAYSVTISAAFLHGEDKIAWKLLDEMQIDYGKIPQSIVYSAYIKAASQIKTRPEAISKVEKLFHYLHKNDFKLDSSSVDSLIDFTKKFKFTTSSTTITHKGVCKCCNHNLKSFEITEEEFTHLKEQIIHNVIIGGDVFNKSTPEELEKFKVFVAEMGNFDVVVDGLNVAYSTRVHNPLISSGLVRSVVSHFVEKGKKVLVLGRDHMNKWPKQNWDVVLKSATVFLAQDLSQDDPYLLYCALNSGKDTILVSRDLMRSHKFLLRKPDLKRKFDRWLSQRQYQLIRVNEAKIPIFKTPHDFSDLAQKNEQYWHIPYDSVGPNEIVLCNWLCIKL